MENDCTELFQRYREMARVIWNLGFWVDPKLREWDSAKVFREVTARLFEGMVLLSLGYQGRISDTSSPGEIASFFVAPRFGEFQLMVDKNLPDEPVHLWGKPTIRVTSRTHAEAKEPEFQLRFVRFFDWDHLSPREFRFLEVVIERLDSQPALIRHHAVVEFSDCSVWFAENGYRQA